MHTSFLARALYALYRFCDEDGFSTLLSSKGERSSSGEHAALWPRMFFFEFFASWKFCVFTRVFTFICDAGTLLAIYTSHWKDETSSFLYPAEFLSGVTSYEKSQSALHR